MTTKRSHPPTLLTIAERTLDRECGVLSGGHVLAAVSGGRDSMALLHVLATLRDKIGFTLAAHCIDHALRDREEVAREIAKASAFAAKLGVPFGTTQLEWKDRSPQSNVHATARTYRRSVFDAVRHRLHPEAVIATAHHADDRAETMLIRVLRGASGSGLGILPPRAGFYIRPLVRASRADIDLHVQRHRIPFSDDPSNEDRRYLRTRVRTEVLPLLRQLDPNVVSHLCAVADDVISLRGDRSWSVLPRATREALVTLEKTKNRRMRVALPGSMIARYDADSGALVVEPEARPSKSRRS